MSLAKKEIKVLEISYRNIFIYNLPKIMHVVKQFRTKPPINQFYI